MEAKNLHFNCCVAAIHSCCFCLLQCYECLEVATCFYLAALPYQLQYLQTKFNYIANQEYLSLMIMNWILEN